MKKKGGYGRNRFEWGVRYFMLFDCPKTEGETGGKKGNRGSCKKGFAIFARSSCPLKRGRAGGY